MYTWIMLGLSREFTATTCTSPQDKSVAELKASVDSGRSLPNRKKLKNAVQVMAKMTTFSGVEDESRLY